MKKQSNIQFYQQTVLPSLFDCLDRAFPEFHWSPTTLGWKGVKTQENGSPGGSVVSNHPWGFVDERGNSTSWFEYENANSSCDFDGTVGDLAKRAGVTNTCTNHLTDEEEQEAVAHLRRQDLLEQFVAHCNFRLSTDQGDQAAQTLHSRYGVETSQIPQLDIGLFTTAQEVGECLVHAGFTHDEILASTIVGDTRVPGRIIIPWRDCNGQIKTIIARDLSETGQSNLYLRDGIGTVAFGLNVALRPSAGGQEDLVIVEDILDVIFFQSIGELNVAAVIDSDEALTGWHWERLAQSGVKSVTLAFDAKGNCPGSPPMIR